MWSHDRGTAEALASGRHLWKPGILVMLRTTLSVSALFAAYFLIPTRSADDGSDLPWLILELCVFGVVVGSQVPMIVKAEYPILRAVETMAVVVPLYLLIFARIYLSSSLNDPSGFTQPLDDVTALYFTVTVFASVGFGDIVAQTDSLRLVGDAFRWCSTWSCSGWSSDCLHRRHDEASPGAGRRQQSTTHPPQEAERCGLRLPRWTAK